MNEPIKAVSPADSSRGGTGPIDFVLSRLSSLKFALGVVLLIALACIAGTLIPQGAQEGSAYVARHPDARPVIEVLSTLGLTRVFYSSWFAGLLCVFAASLMACTARRYAMIRRTTGAVRVRVIGSFITHISLILVLAGGVVRVLWGQKGVIQLHEGEVARQAESPEGPIVFPFSIRLAKFELELYENPAPPSESDKLQVQWLEKKLQVEFPIDLKGEYPVVPADAPAGAEPAFRVSVLRYVPDFAFDGASGEVMSRSEEPNNPAVQVAVSGGGITNTHWVFARFPDFGAHADPAGAATPMPLKFRLMSAQAPQSRGRQAPIKAYKSTLEVLEGGTVVSTPTIAVNSPFSHRGYTFYQVSYNPNDLTWSALQVVKDPGVPIVYGGFILMMVGLTLVFCVGPWIGSQGQTPTKGGIS